MIKYSPQPSTFSRVKWQHLWHLTIHKSSNNNIRACICCQPAELLNPWIRVLLEKLTLPQRVKKFPAFYEIWRFIAAFTRARHLSLFYARSIQSMPLSYSFKIHFNIILPSTPRPSKCSFPLTFPHQNPICTSSSPSYVTCSRPSASWDQSIYVKIVSKMITKLLQGNCLHLYMSK